MTLETKLSDAMPGEEPPAEESAFKERPILLAVLQIFIGLGLSAGQRWYFQVAGAILIAVGLWNLARALIARRKATLPNS